MSHQLEKKLNSLIHQIKSIHSELILKEPIVSKPLARKKHDASWETLGHKISATWDSVSAIDEISLQREKPA
jgi:hypothetical protein